MSTPALQGSPVLVVGAGLMGTGIAQVASQSGHRVMLFDTRDDAAVQAKTKLAATLDALAVKGKLTPQAVHETLERIVPIDSLQAAAHAGLVVEAIVEQLDAKRALFAQLEAVVSEGCVIATNTSSISVTALAQGMKQPRRLVGMHFFNPVPLMKLVEVVSGVHTAPGVAEAIFDLSTAWGKTPVHTKSTPGFIVNRIARPYYAEALALLQEQACTPAVIDACLRSAGFRMGPCELMDLIGHDTNFAVTRSVYEANFFDKRFVPSLVQKELVDGGLFGRKSGRGFYTYPPGPEALPAPVVAAFCTAKSITVHGTSAHADALEQRLTQVMSTQGWGPAREHGSDWCGLQIDDARLAMSDGRTARTLARAWNSPHVTVFDRFALDGQPGGALAYCAHTASDTQAAAWLHAIGFTPLPVADTPGLIVARTTAMLINEAADAVQQGVCTPAAADAAMKLGVNYPQGPFEWLSAWDTGSVVGLLDALDFHYRGERYRASPWLRERT
jgi:3-hydroxybutyryl-CoA dehydrogenase